MTMRMAFFSMMAAALCIGTAACGDDAESDHGDGHGEHTQDAGGAGSGGGDEIEIAGTWTSDFGDAPGDVVIDSESWQDSFFEAEIVEFDNEQNFTVTRNPDDAEYMPGKFNKIVWTEPDDDGFHFCTVDYDLDTADDAASTTMTADADDLDGGCGGMPWTQLMPE